MDNQQSVGQIGHTERFVDEILSISYATLPLAAISMAKQVTLDGVGVILAGSTEPLGVGRVVTQYVKEMGGAPDATVVAGGFKTSMPNAAFANGTMAHALDFDNSWNPPNHPTSPTLPAILAVAEKLGSSGSDVIEAIAVAFEVQARTRLAAGAWTAGEGFHKPGVTGTLGATAAAGRLLKLDKEQMLMALGTAGSRAGSMSLNTGTMTKSSHSGHAARMGVECAILAGMGWTANRDIFGPGGFFDTFIGAGADLELLHKNFASPLRMVSPGVGFKKHPSNFHTQRPIDAALALRSEHNLKPTDIKSVEVNWWRFPYVDRPQPETGLEGKFSIQYATTIALLDGEVTVDSFTNERRFSRDVEEFLPRVHLNHDPSIPALFDDAHVDMVVHLNDGRSLSQRVKELAGYVGFPLSRDQRLKKFRACARRVVEANKIERIIELIETLEDLSDVNEVMNLISARSID